MRNGASLHWLQEKTIQSLEKFDHWVFNLFIVKSRVKRWEQSKQTLFISFNEFYAIKISQTMLLRYSFSSKYRVFWQHWQLGTHFPGQRSSIISSVMIFVGWDLKDSMNMKTQEQIWEYFWNCTLISISSVNCCIHQNATTQRQFSKDSYGFRNSAANWRWRRLFTLFVEEYKFWRQS